MADTLKVKGGPAPHLARPERKPTAKRKPTDAKDAAIKRQIAAATSAAKAEPPGAPGVAGAPAKQPGKFRKWAESHKAELGIGIAASLIAAYIFSKLNGSGSGILTGSSNPSNPQPGGAGTAPTSSQPGDILPPPGGGGGGGGGTTPTKTTTTTSKPTGTAYSKTPSSQPVKVSSHPLAKVGSKTPANIYGHSVNKSGIPGLGSSPGAINPNYFHDTIPAGHSRQNVNPNLAPQVRQQTNYGSGRAQPTVGGMSAAQRLNAAFQSYRRSHPGATSAEFAAALNAAAQAARNRSVTKGAGRENVTHTAYRTRITGASQVHPSSAYRRAHGAHSSYAPQVRALR